MRRRPEFQIRAVGDLFVLWSRPSLRDMWVLSVPVKETEIPRLIDHRLDSYSASMEDAVGNQGGDR